MSEGDVEDFESFKANWLKFCRSGMTESFLIGVSFGVVVTISLVYHASPIIAAIYSTLILLSQRVLVYMKDCESEKKLNFVGRDDDDDSDNSGE